MTEELQHYEKSLKKEHRFSWAPKYEAETRTSLNSKLVIAIIIKTFEKLDWELLYQDKNSAEAKRKLGWNDTGTKISVAHHFGKLLIKSESLGSEIWDNGQNSKRVKLFIHAFHQTEKSYDRNTLAELEKEVEKTNNWDDYIIPESLPKPEIKRKPQFWMPIVGGIFTALLVGLIVAFLSVKGIYIIGVFELVVGIILGFAVLQLIKVSNYAFYNHLSYLLIAMVFITYVSNQYFQYQIIIQKNDLGPFSFYDYLEERFHIGLTVNKMNTGWIGLLISWALQLVLTYYISSLKFVSGLNNYLLNRVPMEVVDFAYYHFVKENTEQQVRAELSKMGWSDSQNQGEVLEAIEAIGYAQELNRIQ